MNHVVYRSFAIHNLTFVIWLGYFDHITHFLLMINVLIEKVIRFLPSITTIGVFQIVFVDIYMSSQGY